VQNKENIPNDKSLADRDFHVFMTCGTNERVVSTPAIIPNISVVLDIITVSVCML
jgi:hypothetical protein